jgi:osmotically-inducible protein OsmY
MNNARYLLGALAAAAIAVALGGLRRRRWLAEPSPGGMVATDRRSTGTQVDDQNIELRAVKHPEWHARRAGPCQRDQLQRAGADHRRGAHRAGQAAGEQIVGKVPNVRSVVNELG